MHQNNGFSSRAQPDGHFPPSTGSEYLDVLFAGSRYEPSTICSICEASQFHVPVIFWRILNETKVNKVLWIVIFLLFQNRILLVPPIEHIVKSFKLQLISFTCLQTIRNTRCPEKHLQLFVCQIFAEANTAEKQENRLRRMSEAVSGWALTHMSRH